MAWKLQSLEALAGTSAVDVTEAERQCLQLSLFLTQAPTDFLEPLMNSPFGRIYKLFLERCCTNRFTGQDAENRRNTLSQQLRHLGCESPEGWAVLLAIFPFFPPDELKVEDAASKLPGWLDTLYSTRYEATQASTTHSSSEGKPSF